MRFDVDSTIWAVKQQILCTLNQSLKDVLNYGLFLPANNGQDGKFLDEEHLLSEYPQATSKSIPTLEVKRKKNSVSAYTNAIWALYMGTFVFVI